MPFIRVKHNIEVAHRLSLLNGKCENIHGHSMKVELTVFGVVDARGILEGIDFADLKRIFREHLDSTYDHHLLLNGQDPLIRYAAMFDQGVETTYPGLHRTDGDPTTENIAQWIKEYMGQCLVGFNVDSGDLQVTVWETEVNMAGTD